jgi:hypothetical protein
MLFDLRSRGRRRTVQVVYLGLAVLIGGGLILFGVGTGSGGGGLLNGLTGNGSNQQSAVLSSQETAALKQVKADPNSASAWGNLVSARWENASSSGFDQATGTYTSAGKKELAQVAVDWQHYEGLTSSPDPIVATIAGRAENAVGNYAGAAGAWEAVVSASPSQPSAYQCLAVSAYAAKQTRKGDLALQKLQTLVSKTEAKTLATEIKAAQTQPTLAASLC